MEGEARLKQHVDQSEGRIIERIEAVHSDVRRLNSKTSMLDGDLLLSFDEVCQILNVSERQVRRYRETGKLTGFMLGGRRLYRKSEVDGFVERMARESEM